MNTPSQNARWFAEAALLSLVQAASAPAAPTVEAASWPVMAGLAPLQAIDAVAALRGSLASGPALDGATRLLQAALDVPAVLPAPAVAGAAAPVAASVAGAIDLAPFQAALDEFRAAEQALSSPLPVPALAEVPGIVAAPAAAGFVVQDGAGASRAEAGEATDGAVDYLRAQYIHAGQAGVSVGAAVSDVFIKGGVGDDALAARAGRNVLDGGQGSNFLVGGTGLDTYFIDGRGGQATWGTVVGFEAGEIITLWGYDPLVSRLSWVESQGAAGHTGRTLHADLDGDGAATALVTISGADAAAASRWAVTTGSDGTNPYLAIINLG